MKTRRGQQRLREATLQNYNGRCAVCDLLDGQFLIASHIDRWSDNDEARGELGNVLLLCRIHDALFEHCYFSLDDQLRILKRPVPAGSVIEAVLRPFTRLTPAAHFAPDKCFLAKHRTRASP